MYLLLFSWCMPSTAHACFWRNVKCVSRQRHQNCCISCQTYLSHLGYSMPFRAEWRLAGLPDVQQKCSFALLRLVSKRRFKATGFVVTGKTLSMDSPNSFVWNEKKPTMYVSSCICLIFFSIVAGTDGTFWVHAILHKLQYNLPQSIQGAICVLSIVLIY